MEPTNRILIVNTTDMYRVAKLYGIPYKSKVICHKRATKYRALVRNMTCKDEASCASPPLCMCTTTHCHYNALPHTATYCNTLHPIASHCNTLQHTATYCNILQHTASPCNTLQHNVTYCNTLHPTALHCITIDSVSSSYL